MPKAKLHRVRWIIGDGRERIEYRPERDSAERLFESKVNNGDGKDVRLEQVETYWLPTVEALISSVANQLVSAASGFNEKRTKILKEKLEC